MNKDNQGGFTGNPEEQSYEDYLKQQQSEMAQEMSDAGKQAPKGAGGESGLDDAPGPKKDNPIDGDFQIEDFSGEGSYDSYLAGQSGLDDKEGKGGRGGKANELHTAISPTPPTATPVSMTSPPPAGAAPRPSPAAWAPASTRPRPVASRRGIPPYRP